MCTSWIELPFVPWKVSVWAPCRCTRIQSSNSCSGCPAVAMLKKINKHNMKSADLQLFDFAFCPCVLFISLCAVLIVQSCRWQDIAAGETRGSPSHCPQCSLFPTFTHKLRQRNYCPSDTLNTLCEAMAFFFLHRVEKWSIESAGRGGERGKEDKTMSDPLRADLSLCNTILCTPPNLIPFKHTLTLLLTKPAQQHYEKPHSKAPNTYFNLHNLTGRF